ncbi:MAG: putative quinol monooxygenase [Bacteroidales bacterium]
MTELKIIATIVAKADTDTEIYAALQAVVNGTRTEDGNKSYTLHRDTSNPLKYVIIEEWKSQSAIDTHNASDHFQQFIKDIEGKLDYIDVTTIQAI